MAPTSPTEDRPDVDRRIHERVAARIEVHFKGPEQAARAFRAYSLNFSVGGLCFRTERTYQLGQVLHVSMTVESQSFELAAVVAWSHKGAIGVRFEQVPERDQERLRSVMNALKR